MPETLKSDSERLSQQEQNNLIPPSSPVDPNSISNFHFTLPAFEGPLDLLLHLIREHKIDIYDIPILEITSQYLGYIELMKELNLEIAGEFLVMAATLIHIKSRMLLPVEEKEQDEPAEDPRAELVQRLLEYQAYRDSSKHLRKREDIWKNIFQRNVPEEDYDIEPEPLFSEANVFDLIKAFQQLLEKAPAQDIEITRETLTVADKINHIAERLDKEDSIKFFDLFEEGYTKITLLVTFLALLEVIRLGLAKMYQEQAFGSIWIMSRQKEESEMSQETEGSSPEVPLSDKEKESPHETDQGSASDEPSPGGQEMADEVGENILS